MQGLCFVVYFYSMKKWIGRITPFVILCVLAVFGMLYFLVAERNSAAEVRYAYLVLLLPIVLGMAVADLVLWRLIKQKKYWLWLVEILLLLALVYFWIVKE